MKLDILFLSLALAAGCGSPQRTTTSSSDAGPTSPPMDSAVARADPEPVTLPLGTRLEGALSDGDRVRENGALADDYTLTLRAQQRIQVDVTAALSDGGAAIDTYVLILHHGNVLGENDDGEMGSNSQVIFVAPEAGTYTVRVTTTEGGRKDGGYAVVAAEIPAERVVPPPLAVSVGAVIEGQLEAADQRLEDGSAGDDYALVLTLGQRVRIVVEGGSRNGGRLDTYLLVLQGTEIVARNDNPPARRGSATPQTNAELDFTAPKADSYIVRVTSTGGGLREAPYTLRILDLPTPRPRGH